MHSLVRALLVSVSLAAPLAKPAPAAPPKQSAADAGNVPEALKSLGAKVGSHYAFKGTTLSFKSDQPLTPDQWKAVESVVSGGVRFLSTGGRGLTNADVARLATLPLDGLSIDGATLTDAAFEPLGQMKQLKSLGLSHALKLKGEGSGALANLQSLESLNIGGTAFGDAGMPHVATLKHLKKLSLNHDQVTDAGVAALADHPSLESLMISPQMTPRMTDASLQTIATIKPLKELTVAQIVLSYDAGLKHLKQLPSLEKLTLNECGIEAADLAKLRADLPKVQLKFTPAAADAVAKWRAMAERKKAAGK